jgi:hypothetical protein
MVIDSFEYIRYIIANKWLATVRVADPLEGSIEVVLEEEVVAGLLVELWDTPLVLLLEFIFMCMMFYSMLVNNVHKDAGDSTLSSLQHVRVYVSCGSEFSKILFNLFITSICLFIFFITFICFITFIYLSLLWYSIHLFYFITFIIFNLFMPNTNL